MTAVGLMTGGGPSQRPGRVAGSPVLMAAPCWHICPSAPLAVDDGRWEARAMRPSPAGADVSGEAAAGRLLRAGRRVAVRPAVDGLDQVTVWTNRAATKVRDIPSRVLLVGGSAVGTEMGQFYAGMGAQVTIVQRAGRRAGRPGTVRAGCRRPHRGHPGQSRKVGQAVVTLDDGSQVETDVVILAPTAPRERRDPAWRPPGCS